MGSEVLLVTPAGDAVEGGDRPLVVLPGFMTDLPRLNTFCLFFSFGKRSRHMVVDLSTQRNVQMQLSKNGVVREYISSSRWCAEVGMRKEERSQARNFGRRQ